MSCVRQPARAAADFVQALLLWDRDPKLLADVVASDKVLDRALTLFPGDAADLAIDLLLKRVDHLARQGRWVVRPRAVLARVCTLPWEEYGS